MSDIGAMDVSLVETIAEGARLLLASHAYFVTSAAIPERIHGNTPQFRVVSAVPRHGSYELSFIVEIAGVIGTGILGGMAERFGENLYRVFLEDGIMRGLTAVAERRKLRCVTKTVGRTEPDLPWPELATNGDVSVARHQLRENSEKAIEKLTNPIRRDGGCSVFEVRIDSEKIGEVSETLDDAPSYADDYRRIADAVLKIRAGEQ